MKVNYALVAYPLSQAFHKQLETEVGEPIHFFSLGELREKSLVELWRFLRALKVNTFFVPIEDYGTKIFLPILQLIVKVAAPKQIVVVDPEFRFKKVKFKHILGDAFQLVSKTCFVNLYYRFSRRSMDALLRESIIEAGSESNIVNRVLYLNTNLWFGIKAGGSVGHIAGVVNALANKKLVVDYVAADASSSISSKVNYYQLPDLRGFGVPAVLNYYYFNRLVNRYLSLEDKPEWDFIYQRMSISNFSGVTLSRRRNIPLILEYNGSEAWIAKNWAGRREHDATIKSEEISLKHAQLVVTVSDVLKDELITRGVPPEKIVFYPNCINPKLFDPNLYSDEDNLKLRRQCYIAEDSLVITFVGTFGQWHGVDILAETIRLLIKENEAWLQAHKVQFLLVGDGVKMPEVKRILGNCIDSHYVRLTGLVPQKEAPAYLAASDILLSPHVANADGSRFFGSPTKLFEYMAMGKAIVASDLDQIGDILKNSLNLEHLPKMQPTVEHTELALLVEPGNAQRLREGIQFLVENKSWRDVLGRNVRQEALAKYTWDKHVDAFLSKLGKTTALVDACE